MLLVLLPLPPPLSDLSGGEVEVNYAALATECLLIDKSLPYLLLQNLVHQLIAVAAPNSIPEF